jgi:hypothetical protein
MMKKYMTFIVILGLVCNIVPLSANNFPGRDEEFNRLGQSTMSFLNIDVGARAVGMGGVFTCIEKDVSALFWNPAGTAKIRGGIVSINHTQWIADMKQYAFAGAYGDNNLGVFGFTFLMMDNGSIERTIPDPTSSRGFILDGTFNVAQWAAGIAYSRQLTNKFGIGLQVKYAFQNLGDAAILVTSQDSIGQNITNKESTIAFDFGTLYYFGFKDLRIGMSLRNFSRPVTYSYESFNLPVVFRIGVAMDILSLLPEMTDHKFQAGFEVVYPYDHGEKVQIGGEYFFKNLLALRLGYQTNTDVGAFSAGFGLTPGAFSGIDLLLDYAYSNADEAFGSIHRFSFGFRF